MSYVRPSTLRAMGATQPNADAIAPVLNRYLAMYQISAPKHIAMLLGQFAHETANFNLVVEPVSGYCANYRGGCRYRGRGIVHNTHQEQYAEYARFINANLARVGRTEPVDFVRNPDLVGQLPFSVDVGFWFLFDRPWMGTPGGRPTAERTRRALETENETALGLIIWSPARADAALAGRGVSLPSSQSAVFADASRQRRTDVAEAQVQGDLVAYNAAQARPTLPSASIPGVSTASVGASGEQGRVVEAISNFLTGLFKVKPVTPGQLVASAAVSAFPAFDPRGLPPATSPASQPAAISYPASRPWVTSGEVQALLMLGAAAHFVRQARS